MPEEDFIIAVFCCVDDLLQSAPELLGVRRGGFAPRLCGSEAVMMEVVGEFLAMTATRPSGATSAGTGSASSPAWARAASS